MPPVAARDFVYGTFALAAGSFVVLTVSGTSGATVIDSARMAVAPLSTTPMAKVDIPGFDGVPAIARRLVQRQAFRQSPLHTENL